MAPPPQKPLLPTPPPQHTPAAPTPRHQDIKFFLHNHLRFTILYNRDAATDLSRIVGFEVEAFSVKHEKEGATWDAKAPKLKTCDAARNIPVSHNQPPQPIAEGQEVIFTYDVKWQVRTRGG
jgi:transmembrane 9 superfamily protein 2/4